MDREYNVIMLMY